MSVEPSQTELLEVQEFFGLPSTALVEKDYYVVKALRALSGVDLTPLSIVFGGGTSLSRAHRLIRRMSEEGEGANRLRATTASQYETAESRDHA